LAYGQNFSGTDTVDRLIFLRYKIALLVCAYTDSLIAKKSIVVANLNFYSNSFRAANQGPSYTVT